LTRPHKKKGGGPCPDALTPRSKKNEQKTKKKNGKQSVSAESQKGKEKDREKGT